MSSSLQTFLALAIVAGTVALLLRSILRKRGSCGCGGSCGAVSPEIKKLQARLKK